MIRLTDIVGSPIAVSTEKAQMVYEFIAEKIQADEQIVISFEGVRSLISAFLNVAIGQLYGNFSEEDIRTHLRVSSIEPEDVLLLKDVVERAKQYFSNPVIYQEAAHELIGSDAV